MALTRFLSYAIFQLCCSSGYYVVTIKLGIPSLINELVFGCQFFIRCVPWKVFVIHLISDRVPDATEEILLNVVY